MSAAIKLEEHSEQRTGLIWKKAKTRMVSECGPRCVHVH